MTIGETFTEAWNSWIFKWNWLFAQHDNASN